MDQIRKAEQSLTGNLVRLAGIEPATLGFGGQNWADVSLLAPSGAEIGVDTNISTRGFIDPVALPAGGTYVVRFHPINGSTGQATIAAYDVPADPTGSISPGGASVATTTTVPGQNARLTFSGSAGQRVSLSVSGANLTGQLPTYLNTAVYRILDPGDAVLGSASTGSANAFVDAISLGANGTYAVQFDPSESTIGTATFTLHDVPADPTSSVTVNGSTTTVVITTPGQNGYVDFAGTSGQSVTVRITNNSVSGAATVSLRNPAGSTIASATSSSSSFNLATQNLTQTGTYTIFVNPSGGTTGSMTIAATSP